MKKTMRKRRRGVLMMMIDDDDWEDIEDREEVGGK